MKLHLISLIHCIPFLVFGMDPSSKPQSMKPTLEILLSLKGPYKLSEIKDGPALLISDEGKKELKMKLEGRRVRYGDNQFSLPLYTRPNVIKPAHTLYFYRIFEFDKKADRLKVNVRSLDTSRKLTASNFFKKNETPTLEISLNAHGIITSLYFKAFQSASRPSSEPKSKKDEHTIDLSNESDRKLLKHWLWSIWDEIGEGT